MNPNLRNSHRDPRRESWFSRLFALALMSALFGLVFFLFAGSRMAYLDACRKYGYVTEGSFRLASLALGGVFTLPLMLVGLYALLRLPRAAPRQQTPAQDRVAQDRVAQDDDF